ncbi:unannotated protein [freshwater metagenome]|uniref:Unannotated protein n=1 Tax=freshwater metagenome TaxID=449393 RepID=A0A6J6DJM3_9ZZZZ
MMDVGMMTATEVPLATTFNSLKNTIIAGTITTPPPMPRSPARVPVARPMNTRAIAVTAVMASRPSAVMGMNSRIAVAINMAANR